MTPRFFSTLLAVPVLWAVGGCSVEVAEPRGSAMEPKVNSASGGSSSVLDSPEPASDGGAPAEELPSVVPFDQLLVQTVQWFDKDVTIVKAETRTSVSESWLGSGSVERGHAITFTVQNRTRFASELEFEHWDLLLADGTRLKEKTDLLDFGPQDALSFELWYEDESEQSLEGAYLELNGKNYGVLEPLIIPLDAPVEGESALRLGELEGLVLEGELDDDHWRHEILSARVARSSDAQASHMDGERAEFGKKLVDLVVKTTAVNDITNLFDETYHLLVGETGVSPSTHINEAPKVGEFVEVPVVFHIDADITEFELEFDVAHHGSDWRSVHVDLENATPEE